MARNTHELSPRVFFVSTDYVFDTAAVRPYELGDPIARIDVYGESNTAGEKALWEY